MKAINDVLIKCEASGDTIYLPKGRMLDKELFGIITRHMLAEGGAYDKNSFKFAGDAATVLSKLILQTNKLVESDKMPWGKYNKQNIGSVPARYLVHIFDNNMCHGLVKEYIAERIDKLRVQAKIF